MFEFRDNKRLSTGYRVVSSVVSITLALYGIHTIVMGGTEHSVTWILLLFILSEVFSLKADLWEKTR